MPHGTQHTIFRGNQYIGSTVKRDTYTHKLALKARVICMHIGNSYAVPTIGWNNLPTVNNVYQNNSHWDFPAGVSRWSMIPKIRSFFHSVHIRYWILSGYKPSSHFWADFPRTRSSQPQCCNSWWEAPGVSSTAFISLHTLLKTVIANSLQLTSSNLNRSIIPTQILRIQIRKGYIIQLQLQSRMQNSPKAWRTSSVTKCRDRFASNCLPWT
jgi:hypothetical protein